MGVRDMTETCTVMWEATQPDGTGNSLKWTAIELTSTFAFSKYILCAEDDDDREEWVQAIKELSSTSRTSLSGVEAPRPLSNTSLAR